MANEPIAGQRTAGATIAGATTTGATTAPGLLRIAAAARAVGVSPSALRLWERQGLVAPVRLGGRERRYGPDQMIRLRCIHRLRTIDGLNAAGIRRALDEGAGASEGTGGPGASRVDAGRAARPDDGRAPAEPAAVPVGTRLRALRSAAGLSLRAVSARTGLSASFVSGLERGTTGASLAALMRLADTYGTTVGAILGGAPARDDATAGPAGRVVRGDARARLEAGHGVHIEELAHRATQLQPQLFVLTPGATSAGAYAHAGEEFLFVLAGRLAVWLDGGERHDLAPGDALTFPSSLPHRFVALGREETRVLWVNTPPTF